MSASYIGPTAGSAAEEKYTAKAMRRLHAYEALRPFLIEAHTRLSYRAMADRSGVDHSTISRIINDGQEPTLTTAIKLVRALSR